MPTNYSLVPTGPGSYTEWAGLSGAPTHWQAVQSASDSSKVFSSILGARDSYVVSVPSLGGMDRIDQVTVRGWIAWGGSPVSGNCASVAFVRVGGVDYDIGTWSVPQFDPDDPTIPGPVTLMPDIILPEPLLLRGSPFELGVRRTTSRRMDLHAIAGTASVVLANEAVTLVGGFRN